MNGMRNIKVGLLPLYAKLYDDATPERRDRLTVYYKKISDRLANAGLDVIEAPICCVRSEFEEVIGLLEKSGVEAIITLHLTYSPSLESAQVLNNTYLPLIILDTTDTYDFGPEQDPAEIFYNHGIHGVQDLCVMLKRMGKHFMLEAGHWEKSGIIDRVKRDAVICRMITRMRTLKCGIIGMPFEGMGDFQIPFEYMSRFVGYSVSNFSMETAAELTAAICDKDIDHEIRQDKEVLDIDVDPVIYANSIKAGLIVRKWIEQQKLGAFSVNFLDFRKDLGLQTLPLLEASKSMSRGIGYGGEGDIITAAFLSALMSVYPETTFSEMFCPDWKGGSIYMSHMSEINLRTLAGRPIIRNKKIPYIPNGDFATVCGRLKPGPVVMASLAPDDNGRFTLVLTKGSIMDINGNDRMENSVHGWFKPGHQLDEFLPSYSNEGGTHHLVLSYDAVLDDIRKFGLTMGWHVVEI